MAPNERNAAVREAQKQEEHGDGGSNTNTNNNSNGKSNSKGNSSWHWTRDKKFCVRVSDVEGIYSTRTKITLSHNWIFGQRKCRQIPFDVIVLKFGIYAQAHTSRSPPNSSLRPSIHREHWTFFSFLLSVRSLPFCVCVSLASSSSLRLFVFHYSEVFSRYSIYL